MFLHGRYFQLVSGFACRQHLLKLLFKLFDVFGYFFLVYIGKIFDILEQLLDSLEVLFCTRHSFLIPGFQVLLLRYACACY